MLHLQNNKNKNKHNTIKYNTKIIGVIVVLLILLILCSSKEGINFKINKVNEGFQTEEEKTEEAKTEKELNKLKKKVTNLTVNNTDLKKQIGALITRNDNTLKLKNKECPSPNTITDENNIKQYDTAVNNYLDYQKNKKSDINLLNIGNDIQDGLISLIENYDENKNKIIDVFNGKFKSDTTIEEFENQTTSKKKTPQHKKKNNTLHKKPNIAPHTNTNTMKDSSSKFTDIVNENKNISLDKIKETFYNNKEVDGKPTSELDDDLFSYFKYVFDTIYIIFKDYFNLYINKNKLFNLGDMGKDTNTLIGGGILFIIISLGLYFIDISS